MIPDELEWFTDINYKSLNPQTLKKISEISGLTITELSRDLKFSRTNFYNSKINVDPKIRTRLLDIALISNEVLYLYAGDKDKAFKWILSPNDLFFGSSPYHMALKGKGRSVLEKLYEMSGNRNRNESIG